MNENQNPNPNQEIKVDHELDTVPPLTDAQQEKFDAAVHQAVERALPQLHTEVGFKPGVSPAVTFGNVEQREFRPGGHGTEPTGVVMMKEEGREEPITMVFPGGAPDPNIEEMQREIDAEKRLAQPPQEPNSQL